MASPTRYPGGLTNAGPRDTFGMLGMPDPVRFHDYHDDFDTYVAGQWTVTTVGTTPSAALTNADGGELLLTTTAGATDSIFLQKVGEGFLMEAGKPAFFKSRFKMSDASTCNLVVGLQVTDTTPLDVTDGIYFLKATGSTALQAIIGKNATTGRSTVASVATIVAATYYTVGWYYDGKGLVTYFVNDIAVASSDASSTYLPDTTLTPSFGIQNGAAAIKTANFDYLAAAKFRGSARP